MNKMQLEEIANMPLPKEKANFRCEVYDDFDTNRRNMIFSSIMAEATEELAKQVDRIQVYLMRHMSDFEEGKPYYCDIRRIANSDIVAQYEVHLRQQFDIVCKQNNNE